MSIIAMARMGRNGDTKMAHVTTGDVVVPRAAAKASPGLVAQVAGGFRKIGGDPQKYVVGSGNRNPKTGAEEFADPLVPGEPTQPLNQATNAVFTNDAPTTQATIQGGMSAADYAASLGAPNTYYGKDVNYGYVSPDPSWNQNGNYNGLGLTSDVYGATNGTTTGSRGFTPSDANNYAANVPGANFGITSGITQNNGSANSVMTDGSGNEVAVWGPGQKVGVDAPASLDAGYAWKDGQIVRVADNGGGAQSSGGGLIGSAGGASQLGSPTKWSVDPSQTVEGRIASIIDPNNPIIQQARAQSLADANARGLANTSMAQTAGDAAAYQAAIPIAQPDAATLAKAAGYNADEQNQFAIHNVDATNQFGLTGMSLASQQKIAAANNATQLEQARIGAKSALDVAGTNSATQLGTAQISAQSQQAIAKLNAETNTATAQLDAASRERVASLQAANQTLINTNQQAAQAFNQAVVTVAAINQNTNMDATTKTQAIAQVWDTVNKQLKTLGAVSNTNVGSTLNLANYPGFDAQGNWVGFGTTTNTGTSGGIVGGAGASGTV